MAYTNYMYICMKFAENANISVCDKPVFWIKLKHQQT